MLISATVITEAQKEVVKSFYLLELQLAQSVLRYSSQNTVQLLGAEYIEGDFNRPSFQVNNNGELNGAIEFGNADLSMTALIIKEGLRGKKLKVWQVFGQAPYSEDNVVCLFDGYVDSATRSSNLTWRLMLKAVGGYLSLVPHHVIAPPLCNHLPEDGKVIQWNNQIITLETRR